MPRVGSSTPEVGEDPPTDGDLGASLDDTLGDAMGGLAPFDMLEEHSALAQIERRLFARAREPLRLSRYLLLRPLGSGATGVVYDGFDPELARRVAVKVLRPSGKNRESVARSRARFLREAQSIARLSHPNVIAVYDVGTFSADALSHAARGSMAAPAATVVEGEPASGGPQDEDGEATGVFIVMELVDGDDLSSWLERRNRSWREIVDVFVAAGRGLAAAHAASIVHRDFKPGNVLVGLDGRVKVVDFGLALTYGGSDSEGSAPITSTEVSRSQGSEALDKLTRTGAVLGTPAYMAPEQHGGEAADQKADQFAFCAALFRALYGQHAFEGKDVDSLFASKIAGRVRAAPEGRAPSWVHRVVLRGLAVDPEQRFADMHELLRALRADPVRRVVRALRWAALPLGLAGIAYAAWVGTRPGRVEVEASAAGTPVAGVTVEVDGVVLPQGVGEVSAGLHRLRVSAPDHVPVETVVEVERGGVHEVAIELRHEQGTFDLDLEPAGGRVLIDGVDYGARLRNLPVDTGPHEILLRHEGYEDQRLQWTARKGERTRGFVALRKALAWSRPASGSYLQARWLGDVDDDGLDDLVQRRFTMLTAYDPWNDRELWRIELGTLPDYWLCDVDADGTADVITLRHEPEGTTLAVYDGATSERRPAPRWSIVHATDDPPSSPAGPDASPEAESLGPGAVTCVAEPEGAVQVVVTGLVPQTVTSHDGRSGASRWSASIPGADPGLELVALGSDVAVVTVDGAHRLAGDDGAVRWSSPQPIARRTSSGALQADWVAHLRTMRQQDDPWARTLLRAGAAVPDLLVLAAGEGDVLLAIDGADGHVRWRQSVAIEANAPRARGAPRDVDADGTPDVLVLAPDEPRSLRLLSGADGRPLWTRPHAGDRVQLVATSPVPQVVLVDGKDLVVLDARTGTPTASHTLAHGPSSGFAVADWDGDGRGEIIVGTGDATLRAFDTRLRERGAVPLRIPVTALQASRDANHDGFVDLLLQARGPAVVLGPKVRWERRPLDAIRATPVVLDLDRDAQPEVALFGTLDETNRLQILDARTGQVEASSPPGTPIVIRPPAVLETPGGVDLLAAGDGVVRFRGRDGVEIDRFATKAAYATPTVADLDGDGVSEVVMVTWEDPGVVHALDAATLTPRWEHTLGPVGSFGAPHVGDVDGDAKPEVVIAGLDGRVVCLGHDGALEWEAQTGGRLNFRPTVADLDGDGGLEILVAPHVDDDPIVVLRGRDGEQVARWPGVATRRARPLAHDVDGDGRPEVLASTATRGIVGLHGDGRERWRYRFSDIDGLQPAAAGSPVLVDLDGDDRMELMAGFEDGSLHVVDARDGTLVWRYQLGREEVEASPVAADVDGDGRLEVFAAGHDRHLLCLRHLPPP